MLDIVGIHGLIDLLELAGRISNFITKGEIVADFSGDKQGKIEKVASPFDGVLGEETAAQREVRETLMRRQMTVAPDAARDGLGKEAQ